MRYWCSTLPLPLILFCGPGCFNSEAGIQPSNDPVGEAELTQTSGRGDESAADDECRSGDGMPFRLAAGVKVASYGLNSNDDGIQNYGELAVDCGGAGASFCAESVPLDVVEIDREVSYFSGYEVIWSTGTINGRQYQMLHPTPGQDGLARQNTGIVVEQPSRIGSQHAPPIKPWPLQDYLVPGQERGATAIAMTGVTGMHPYTFSAQEAVLASRFLREELELDTVVLSGASYGGAVAQVDASLYAKHFDGVVSGQAPYDGREFLASGEMGRLRSVGAGLFYFDELYYPGIDSMTMAAGQAGLSIENANLTRAENASIPATLFLGEVDGVWLPANQPNEVMSRMKEEGMDWVDLVVVDEEGHGGPELNKGFFAAFEKLYTRIDERREWGAPPPTNPCRLPRERATTYDDVLRAAPEMASDRRVTELWSDVTQLEGGEAARSVWASEDVSYSGSAQGFVTRRNLDDPGTKVWSVPVGRVVQAIEVVGDQVLVGSKRGIAVLDAETGRLIRETLDIGSVTDIVVADLIPGVAGLELAARADMDMLHVETVSSGRVLSSTTIGAGGAMEWSRVIDGQPRLLIPLQRGHVAAMAFVLDEDGRWVPEAQWLSEYLAHDVRAVQPAVVNGEPVLVTGGLAYGDIPELSALVLDDTKGNIDVINLWPYLRQVHNIVDWTPGKVLVSGLRPGFVKRAAYLVDLETGAVDLWLSDVASVAVINPGSAAGAVVWNHGYGMTPSFRLVDADGVELYGEYGRTMSSAMDLYVDPKSDVYEVSVMSRNWNIERFDLFSGENLGVTHYEMPLKKYSAPRRLSRLDGGTGADSYEPFLFDGDVLNERWRVASRCGTWVAANSLAEEQATLSAATDPRVVGCAVGEAGGTPLSAPTIPLMAELLGEPLAGVGGSGLRLVELPHTGIHGILSTPGGQVASYSLDSVLQSTDHVTPDQVVDVAGTLTTLAVSDNDGQPLVAVGSWLPAEDGATLHLLDASTLAVELAIDAGPVVGVTLADIDQDGIDEILTGTQDGYLRIYDQEGAELLSWSAGDLALGENGALFTYSTATETVVVAAVTGGWRVLSIAK